MPSIVVICPRRTRATVGHTFHSRSSFHWLVCTSAIITPAYLCVPGEVQAAVSDDYLWIRKGRQSGKVPLAASLGRSRGIHCTLLTNIGDGEPVRRLRRICSEFSTGMVVVNSVFIGKVDRITDEDVWCVGFTLSSSCVRKIREKWLAAVEPDQQQLHNRYPGEGHVSLCYFKGEHAKAVQDAITPLEAHCVGSEIPIFRVIYCPTAGQCEEILLGVLERSPAISDQLLLHTLRDNLVHSPSEIGKCACVCWDWLCVVLSEDIPYLVWSIQCASRCMCGILSCQMCFPEPYSAQANLDYRELFANGSFHLARPSFN